MPQIFQVTKGFSDWNMTLHPDACALICVSRWYMAFDQYGKWSEHGASYDIELRDRHAAPSDIQGMLARFARETANWTRENINLPRRVARLSPEKYMLYETIVEICNQRLIGGPLSCRGIDTHGLDKVFAPLLRVGAET